LAIVCWTPLFSVAKRTLPHIDAFALGTLRYAIGIVLFVLLLVAVEGRQALRFDGKLGQATLFGLIGITGFNLFVWIGLAFTRPEHASIILALQTPLTALAVWLRRGQRPPTFTLGCVAFAICGVFLVITKGDPLAAFADLAELTDAGGALLGDLIVFCGALCWVTYTLSATQFPQWSPLRLTVLTCIPGAVGLVLANVVALAAGWASLPSAQAIGAVGWQIAYFSVCTVVLGVLGFNNAARRLGPLNTMLMLNLVPVGVFAIEAALGRRFVMVELAGAAMVIGALAANNLYLRGASARR
jgi:drug/metabolite transporter (DMT)-like permease